MQIAIQKPKHKEVKKVDVSLLIPLLFCSLMILSVIGLSLFSEEAARKNGVKVEFAQVSQFPIN